jgi:hypothetical protein
MVALYQTANDTTAIGVDKASALVTVSACMTMNNGGVQPGFARSFYVTVGGDPAGDVVISPFSTDVGKTLGNRCAVLDLDPADASTDVITAIITLPVATSLISPAQRGSRCSFFRCARACGTDAACP